MLKDIALSEMNKRVIDLSQEAIKLRTLTEKPPVERSTFRKTSLLASVDAPRRRKATKAQKSNLSQEQFEVKIKTLEAQLKTANDVIVLYQETDVEQK